MASDGGIGQIEVVKMLLKDPRVDPADVDSCALWYAASYGHLEIVRLLLEDGRVDPTVLGCMALQVAR